LSIKAIVRLALSLILLSEFQLDLSLIRDIDL